MNRARHIGIVAVSAEGAALCYRTICSEGAAVLGPHDHPQVTLHTYPLAEYMQHVEAGRWHEAGRLLLSSANILVRAGADLLICPDNTLHQALDLVRRQAPAPWLHIVEEVAAVAARRGFKGLGILGTQYLMEGPVYREKLAARGIAHEIPEGDDRERINAIIFNELVYGRLEESSKRYFRSVIEILGARGCDAVILGCTEIPLLVTDTESPLPAIDSTRTLARAALREATRSVSARGLRAGRASSTVGAAMPTSKVHPARSVVPAATASKSTKASAEKSAAAKAKTPNSPSAGKGLPRNLEESGSFRRRT